MLPTKTTIAQAEESKEAASNTKVRQRPR